MALTDTAIRKIKPTDKSFKLTDSSGLYLLIKPNGSKLWYMKYRIDGKEKKLAFGPYPDVSLFKARQLRDAARAKVREGGDPSTDKKIAQQKKKNGQTFLYITVRDTVQRRLQQVAVAVVEVADVLPVGGRDIAGVTEDVTLKPETALADMLSRQPPTAVIFFKAVEDTKFMALTP